MKKLKKFTFTEYANSIAIYFDFSSPEIRYFSGNKKLILKILIPFCFVEFVKTIAHGIIQDFNLRLLMLDYITTFNKCNYFFRF